MCMYCERRQDVKFGWDQPKLPYNDKSDINTMISGNVADFSKFEGVIHDYQTKAPELRLLCKGYWGEDSFGTVCIPIKYCPECGRKLGGAD